MADRAGEEREGAGLAGLDKEGLARAMQALTTEHAALETARAATIFEAMGRATVFLSSVSSAVVALAFVGQLSGIETPFFVFGLVLFATLFFLGVVTFERALQVGIADVKFARGVGRIRRFYVESTPGVERYLVTPIHDDAAGAVRGMGLEWSWWQPFLGTAGMIEVINSVQAGVWVGLLVGFAVTRSLAVCGAVGAVAFVLSVVLHHRHMVNASERAERAMPARFPSDIDPS